MTRRTNPEKEAFVRVKAGANRPLGEGQLRAGGSGDRSDGRTHGSELLLGATP